jgi:hypothetical protein
MAKRVKVVRDDAYEQMGSAYQCVLSDILEATLRESGIKSKRRRQEIVTKRPTRGPHGRSRVPVACYSGSMSWIGPWEEVVPGEKNPCWAGAASSGMAASLRSTSGFDASFVSGFVSGVGPVLAGKASNLR